VTVILMLTMFVVFLTIDYFMRRGKMATVEPEVEHRASQAPLRSLPTIGGFELPENRHYHQGHTWALQENRCANKRVPQANLKFSSKSRRLPWKLGYG
jgi:hypothetical protein